MTLKANELTLQELAWIGDGVLALFARQWLIEHRPPGHPTELFTALTSNQFLSCFGRPTEVEAAIGRLYLEQGEAAAFADLQARLVPLFLKQIANRRKV